MRGFFTAAFVALLNDYTCVLLVRAVARLPKSAQRDSQLPGLSPNDSAQTLVAEPPAASGCMRRRRLALSEARAAQDFEELAAAAGGPVLKLAAQLSLCILLMGSMCSNLAVIAEAGSRALQPLPASTTARAYVPPGFAGDAVMLLVLGGIITPLAATKNMNTLQQVAGAGGGLLSLLLLAVVARAASPQAAGLAAARGAGTRVAGAANSQAFVVLSFAFYVQPMMLPLLRELGEGTFAERTMGAERVGFAACGDRGASSPAKDSMEGSYDTEGGNGETRAAAGDTALAMRTRAAAVLELAIHATMLLALVVYTLLGVCGVVAFGRATSEDVLLNFSGVTGCLLDASMVLYMAVCFAPTCHALRRVVYALVDGPAAPLPPRRAHIRRVAALNAAAAAVALGVPRSETLFALTGAVGVSIVCYVFPVLMHMRLVRYKALDAASDGA